MKFQLKYIQYTIIFFIYSSPSVAKWQPDFLIIGAQKSGTTSLYNYIIQHPQVQPARWKELHFFDYHKGKNNFLKGINWYKKQFPTKKQNCIIGESSPEYFLHPLVPQRVHNLFPDIKLILIMRNPTDRAYSHYKMNKKAGTEPLSFEQALEAEEKRIQGEEEKIIMNELYYSSKHPTFSYRLRGHYLQHLKRWLKFFPKEQFLLIKSEDLFNNTPSTMNKVFAFLGIKDIQLQKTHKHNVNTIIKEKIAPETKQALDLYFKPYNDELTNFLLENFNVDLSWTTSENNFLDI